jgi:drug/metabolite transporter (DMT)-like permease
MTEPVVMDSHTRKQILLADLRLLGVAVIWGAGIPLSAVLARSITPLWAVALRMLLSAAILFAIMPKRVLNATPDEWKASACVAIVLTAVFTLMTFGLYFSTASKQAFIGGLNVIIVPFFLWIFTRKKPSNWVFAGATLTTVGLCIMGFSPGMRFNFGDILSFFMAVGYATQVFAASYAAKRVEAGLLVALHIIILAAIMTTLALIFEPIPALSVFTPKVIAALLCVSLLNTILCFFIQFRALRVTPETHAAIILSLEALFGYLIAVISGQDPFILNGAIGGMLMIAGTIVTELEGFVKK